MPFEPIAIVGRGCVLPGALDPDTFWDNIATGRVSLSPVPHGRWGLRRGLAVAAFAGHAGHAGRAGPAEWADSGWADSGGYVDAFWETFDPAGFAVDAERIASLDPLFQWVLHSARQALTEAMRPPGPVSGTWGTGAAGAAGNAGKAGGAAAARAGTELRRAGLVLGNLSFPSAMMARFAAQTWMREQRPDVREALSASLAGGRPDPRNRFSSGFPAHFAARALSLGAGAFSLDAACASALYAVRFACDRLHDGRADLMLAGAVNCVDDLLIRIGFGALSALSRTGLPRPFEVAADGLVPAEGAGFVALMRLADAIATGREVLGVIRGIGLSNDGRAGGLLAPSAPGQIRAIRAAYAGACLAADTVSLVECHATGTRVGDAVEARGLAEVFAACSDLPIGSVKGNIGHPITAAGMAGLLKVLGALRTGIRPATAGVSEPIPELAGTPLRVLSRSEPWPGPRRAALSAFGFGGNNAHLIVDAWDGPVPVPRASVTPVPVSPAADSTAAGSTAAGSTAAGSTAGVSPALGTASATGAEERAPAPGAWGSRREPVAIVAIGARVADGADAMDFARLLLAGTPRPAARQTVEVELAGVAFPPRDLERTHAAQLLVMEAAREATRGLTLPKERTAVLIGMGCDPEVARYHARWRVAEWFAAAGLGEDPELIAEVRNGISPPLDAAGVLGTMPNLVANRINAQLDLAGPSSAISAEEASGPVAVELAARMLAAGDIDAAVVGAVDLSHEPVHEAALAELGRGRPPGDAAVVVVLERVEEARRHGHRVLALVEPAPPAPLPESTRSDPDLIVGDCVGTAVGFDPAALVGTAHAASGMVALGAAMIALHHQALPSAGAPAAPALGIRTADIAVTPFGAPAARTRLRAADVAGWLAGPAPDLHVYSGRDASEVLSALADGRESSGGPARLVIVESGSAEFTARRQAARRWLSGTGLRPDGVAFQPRPLGGDVAFVFTNGSAAYPGMGRDTMLAFPEIMARLEERCGPLGGTLGWSYGRGDRPDGRPGHVLEQILGAALLSQLHTEITRGVLGIGPQAVLGYSSGESAALVSMGAWRDAPALAADLSTAEAFTHGLVGELTAVRRVWQRQGVSGTRWASYLVTAPVAHVRAALDGVTGAHLMAVNAPDVCVVGGAEAECARILAGLPGPAIRIGYEIAVHAPEVAELRDEWWRLHHRPTHPVPGVRFYTGATGGWYEPTADTAADALTAQAIGTVNFDRMVEHAWDDGVRVFIEHGPGGQCSSWIARTLAGRDHLAVPLDSAERGGLPQLVRAVAELVAAGVRLDAPALLSHLASLAPHTAAGAATSAGTVRAGGRLSVPAHPAPVRIDLPVSDGQRMPPAPFLAPVLSPIGAHSLVTGSAAAVVRPGPAAPPGGNAALPVGSAAAALPAVALPSIVLTLKSISAVPGPPAVVRQARPVLPVLPVLPALPARPRPAARAEPAGGWRLTSVATATESYQHTLTTAFGDLISRQAGAHQRFLTLATRLAGTGRATGRAGPSAPTRGTPPARGTRQGPTFDREQLERLAIGPVSELFGPEFAALDHVRRQTRMPAPPMLLVDRVTGIDAVATSMGTGVIWTETDVRAESWYLDGCGRMPAGLMVEAGQADLLLISWLGVDLCLRGDRVYRLLGCELTFHGPPPRPGETLSYEIHIDGHGEHDDIRLFFFRYDCRVGDELRLTMRGGQAGFFTDAELAATGGVVWNPASQPPDDDLPVEAPVVLPAATRFGPDEVAALADGRPADCFDPGCGSDGISGGISGDGTGDDTGYRSRWRPARAHLRSPRIAAGRLLLLREVTEFDPDGGPWGRGYLRAQTPVSPDDWFFDGHFFNDPCMPGTLMFEGALQAMAFYLAACGFTIDRDGWRFEPVPNAPIPMVCRGQVTPTSRLLGYEVFVSGLTGGSGGGYPTLFADVLVTVDGIRAFHARRVGLRLVPDWPLEHWRSSGVPAVRWNGDPSRGGKVASVDGFPFDYAALLASAWGRPSEAFRPIYDPAEDARRRPRLPGPPYLFISRIASVSGPPGEMAEGIEVEADYDVPAQAWYFEQNGYPTMPLAVLMEVALQPCGWLASYAGCAVATDGDVLFRNLDGTAELSTEVTPDTGTLRTRARLRGIARNAGLTIVSFDVEVRADDRLIFATDTTFGFFPPEAFVDQIGLPTSDGERSRFAEDGDYRVELAASGLARPGAAAPVAPVAPVAPATAGTGEARLPGPMLLMIDRITGYWPDGGAAGLGRLRAEKDVDPGEWFFTAHFFTDPVQPGSLGVEAMCQLLQFHLLAHGAAAGVRRPRFEPIVTGRAVTWKYRGQVVPSNRRVTIELEVTEDGADERGRYAVAEAWLWVDGVRIYHVRNLGMRVNGEPEPESSGTRRTASGPAVARPAGAASQEPAPGAAGGAGSDREVVLDATVDTWLNDHRPTWTVPAVPMMSTADLIAGAAAAHSGRTVLALRDVRLFRWLPVREPVRLATRVRPVGRTGPTTRIDGTRPRQGDGPERPGSSEPGGDPDPDDWPELEVTVLGWRRAGRPELSRFEPVARGFVRVGAPPDRVPAPTEPTAPPAATSPADGPYQTGELFHGPGFRHLVSLRAGAGQSWGILDAGRGSVPRGHLHQGLLDAATHVIPHANLWRWSDRIGRDVAGFPHRIDRLELFAPLPEAGTVYVSARFAGFDGDDATRPAFDLRLWDAERMLATVRLVDAMVPTGRVGTAEPIARRAFLRDRRYAGGIGLSVTDGGTTRLSGAEIDRFDWLPGTVSEIYGLPPGARARDHVERVAIQEHVGRLLRVHPGSIVVATDHSCAWPADDPDRAHPVGVERDGDHVVVRDGPASADHSPAGHRAQEPAGSGRAQSRVAASRSRRW